MDLNKTKIERRAASCLKAFKKSVSNKNETLFFPSRYYNQLMNFIKSYDNNEIKIELINNNADMDAFDGNSGTTISGGGNRYIIRINIQDDSKRQKFTLAHEFGHIALKHLKSTKQDRLNKIQTNGEIKGKLVYEKQANIFAASFLMPKEDFIKLAKKMDYNIARIASHLGLSKSAVRTRMLTIL